MITKISPIAVFLCLALSTPGTAELRYDSAVRAAARERVKSKLGAMRGTIDMKQRGTLVTEKMIERWRPVVSPARQSDEFSGTPSLASGRSGLTTIAGDVDEQ